jgi:hypothetical protein
MGTANVLYVDAATYLASFLIVAAFVKLPEVVAEGPPTGVLDGVRFIARDSCVSGRRRSCDRHLLDAPLARCRCWS